MYRSYSIWRNERDFAQARAAIDTVYADIVAKVGQPDNYKRTNNCSRPSQEFGQGPLSCSVGTDFIYGVNDETQANTLFKQIQSVISQHPELLKPTKPLSTSIKDTLVVNDYYHDTQDYYEGGNIACFAKYSFDTPREIDLITANPLKKPMEVNINCVNEAKNQYYPLITSEN